MKGVVKRLLAATTLLIAAWVFVWPLAGGGDTPLFKTLAVASLALFLALLSLLLISRLRDKRPPER